MILNSAAYISLIAISIGMSYQLKLCSHQHCVADNWMLWEAICIVWIGAVVWCGLCSRLNF